MSSQFWSTFFAIGAVLSILLSLALWRRQATTADRVLAGWLLILTYDLAARAAFNANPSDWLVPWYGMANFMPFLHGSLFYLYATLLTRPRPLRWTDAHVLLGLAVVLILNADLFFSIEETRSVLFFTRLERSALINLGLFSYSLTYVAAGLVTIFRYQTRMLDHRADGAEQASVWLLVMGFGQLVIWLTAVAVWQVPGGVLDERMIYGAVTFWLLAVAYLSLSRPALTALPDPTPAPEPSAVDDPRAKAVERRLRQLMENEGLYREPELTIGRLAEAAGYPEYLVSSVINRKWQVNFSDFINRQRIEEVCRRLRQEPDRTVLELALDAGFASKTTFNKAFKRQTGQTPSAYRQAIADTAPSVPD